ncbi:UDP-N-acetylenolpyruvoylglucosamine reductase [Clostridia bacterium]|nr:UDP-N-acetylenolpyruvoylglucosamine reductase [Clostridia bacterium]
MEEIIKLCESLHCECLRHEPLAPHTTFKVGGEADLFVRVGSEGCLADIIKLVKSLGVPFFVIGKGSNLLVSDEGFRGVVISVEIIGVQVDEDAGTIVCGAGVPLAKVAYAAMDSGLSGLEFAAGIPGTVGGGVYMNAGAYGGDIGQVVLSLRYLDTGDCAVKEIHSGELIFGHRTSNFSLKDGIKGIITSVTFQLSAGSMSEIRTIIDDYTKRRLQSQPLDLPSAGSTFKRPPGDYASRLIDVCGLKGMSVGGAQVSRKHAGFIVNAGGASFRDVTELIKKVRNAVFEETGVLLEPEVRTVESGEN